MTDFKLRLRKKKKPKSTNTIWVQRKREEIKKKLNFTCQRCNEVTPEERLDFAHKEPTELNGRGRGSFTRIKDVLNNPQKYCMLCMGCHEACDRYEQEFPNKDVQVWSPL